MKTISKEQLSGNSYKTWTFSKAIANSLDKETQKELRFEIKNIEDPMFLKMVSGYAPTKITFNANQSFEIGYQLQEGSVTAFGNWSINEDGILLEQNTGDSIQLLSPNFVNGQMQTKYSYQSFSHGIEELTYSELE